MTRTKQNKLIAIFMGATEMPDNTIKFRQPDTKFHDGTNSREIEDLKYHSSWDWLMPVVEKIEKDKIIAVKILQNYCRVYWVGQKPKNDPYFSHFESTGETKIDATYKAIIQFIEWYNQNKSI